MQKQKAITIFGIHAIQETILAGERHISKIWLKNSMKPSTYKRLVELAKKHAIPCSKVPLVKLNRLTKDNHQGAIALVAPAAFVDLAYVVQTTYEKGKTPLVILLDQIQDAHNLGAIARTAVATEVDALVVTTHNTLPISGSVMKASAGALAHIALCRANNLAHTIQYLQESGLQVVACTEKADQTLYEVDFVQPTALLLGGEGKGIVSSHFQMANVHVRIPMAGPIDSLNVSVAAAIVLYEVARQSQATQ